MTDSGLRSKYNLDQYCKNVHVLIYLTVFINFCTQIFYKFHKLFPYESPEILCIIIFP